ncbi:MAG TPA: SPOR domain-containing protein [Jiangellaceae bacterium]
MAGPWYWCLDHQRVEAGEGCPNDRRLGPYEDRERAERALEIARERTEAWDAEDAAEDAWDD